MHAHASKQIGTLNHRHAFVACLCLCCIWALFSSVHLFNVHVKLQAGTKRTLAGLEQSSSASVALQVEPSCLG